MIKMQKEICSKCGKMKDKFEVWVWDDGTKEEVCNSCYWELADLKTSLNYLDAKIAKSKRKRRGL